MLFYLAPSLAMLSVALIPPVALAGMYYGQYVQGQQKAVQEEECSGSVAQGLCVVNKDTEP